MSTQAKAYLKVILVLLTGLGMSTGKIAPDHADAFQRDSVTLFGNIITGITAFYALEHSFAQLMGDINGGGTMYAAIKQRLSSFFFRNSGVQKTVTTTTSTVNVPASQ